MVKLISWNPDAEESFEAITAYLQEEISSRAATKFADAVYHKLDLLTLYPEIGRPSLIDSDVRSVKIDKFHVMFYSFDGYKLTVIDFFNTRQDPNKRKY